jgi:hypothetical protein
MKKLAMTLAIVLGLGVASYANGGGLFGQGQAAPEQSSTTMMSGNRLGGGPALPGHGSEGNQPAPLGSGIAVLIGLGAAYAVAKKRED